MITKNMGKLLTIILLFISNIAFSQLKAAIINSETREKIPYVNIWVENENIGTTSNEKGEFVLNIDSPKIILFSAIGFETLKISSSSIKKIIELKPTAKELEGIVIEYNKSNEKLVIGDFKKAKINNYFGCDSTPWITARYFEYQSNYKATSFLDKIRILTNSDVKDSKFNIRLYSINNKEEPDGYIYDKNIIGIARKGKKFTEIDISDLNIKFPKEGFFIAIEWLIVKGNKHKFNYTMQNSKKKMKGISYEPSFGIIPTEKNQNSWIFIQGKWKKVWKNSNKNSKDYNNKYSLLAIELTLTD
jgi:hypothetical protein